MSSADAGQGHVIVTSTDHSALVSIAVYFLMTTFLVSVVIRLVIRVAITRSLSIDDHLASAATIIGVGQSIAVLRGVHYGLGKREDLLNVFQVTDIQKAQYASDILYLAALCLAKISILILLQRLSVSRVHKRIALATAGVAGLWALTGIIVLAAQCGSQLPWTTHQCINMKGFWIGMAPVDVLSELVVVIIPIWMMVPVQVAISKKAVICVAFAFRIPVIAATIARLFYIHPATGSATDATWIAVSYNIATEVVLCISIMTACIPCLKPFLDGFDSGMMGVSFKDRMPGSSATGSRGYKMRDLAYANTKSNNASMMRSQNNEKDMIIEEDPRHKLGVSVEVVADGADRSPGHNHRGDNGSVASSSKSDQMIIKKNIQWTVQYEDAPLPRNETSLSRRQSGTMRDDKSDADTLHHQGDAKIAYAL